MANRDCMTRGCAHCMGRLGCEYPEDDSPGIGPGNCDDYMNEDELEDGFDE